MLKISKWGLSPNVALLKPGFKKPIFLKKPSPLGFFKITRVFSKRPRVFSKRPRVFSKRPRVFSKRPRLFKNPNLVDLGDVLLRFEGFKNMPDQWVLKVYE